MEVFLIRHTRTAASGEIIMGWTDVPLAESFAAEAQAILARVGCKPGDQIVSSPSARCLALAKLFGHPKVEENFRELHFGDWEGRLWSEVQSDKLDAWMADFVTVAPPGGESLSQLFNRVKQGLEALSMSGSRTIIITHAGVLRVAAAYFLELPLANIFRLCCEPGAILRARKTQHGWEVLEWISCAI